MIGRLDALGQLILTLAGLITFVPAIIEAIANGLLAHVLLPSLVISSLAMPIYVGYWRGTMQGDPREAVRGVIYLIYGLIPPASLIPIFRWQQPPLSLGTYGLVLSVLAVVALLMILLRFPIASIENYLGSVSYVLRDGLLDRARSDFETLTILAAVALSVGTILLGVLLWALSLGVSEGLREGAILMAASFFLFGLAEYAARRAGGP